jgi:hypothetical protein
MPHTYQSPDPYAVDPDDHIAVGRIRYAATRGDARARATLRALPETTREPIVRTSDGTVAHGRSLFTPKGSGKQPPTPPGD